MKKKTVQKDISSGQKRQGGFLIGKYFLALPVLLFPYSLFLGMVCLYTPAVMETVFFNNGYLLIAAIAAYAFVAFVFSCVLALLALRKKEAGFSMAWLNMIVKLCQVPAYCVIFVLGCIFFVTVLGIGFTIFFFLFDCVAIGMTGLIGAVSVFRAFAEKKLTKKECIVFALLQFVFVADIVACILLFVRLCERRAGEELAAPSRPEE